jgi:hypothetical protein
MIANTKFPVHAEEIFIKRYFEEKIQEGIFLDSVQI